MALRKHYIYKIYGPTGLYLGSLRKVTSDFSYSQDINVAGIQLQVTVGTTLEGAGVAAIDDLLVDPAGNILDDQEGVQLSTGRTYTFNGIPMDLGNRMKVIMYHTADPNGVIVFDGLITSWSSDYKDNNMVVTAMSWGLKLQQFLIETAVGTPVVDFEVNDGELAFGTPNFDGVTPLFRAQTFKVLSNTTLSAAQVKVRITAGAPVPTVIAIHNGTPNAPGSYLGVVNNRMVSNTTSDYETYTFSAAVNLIGGQTYTMEFYRNDPGSGTGQTVYVGTDSTGSYADGTLFEAAIPTAGSWSDTTHDMNFKLITSSGGGNIGAIYNSKDPSTILRELMDSFTRRGGIVGYTPTSIDDTNTVVSYTFKFNTLFDGIQKCLELAPSNWYWYVDPGTNIVQFHRQAQKADHTFKLGAHVENLHLEYTLDDVKNVVYYSGGNIGGGVNLLTLNTNPASIRKYGVWLDKPSDNRVTLTDTANILSQSNLQQNANPIFRTTVTIPRAVYNIETIKLGQMVDFAGFNSLVNSLLLQIVGLDKNSNMVTVHLQTLPPALSHRVEDIRRNLDSVNTVNNPTTVA
jgi:hypothetical protein